MNTEFRLLTALGVLALAQGAAAAPTLVVKRPPAGLTAAQFQQKLVPILEAQKQKQAQRDAQTQAQTNSALAAIEPERKLLSAALARDPRYQSLVDQARGISLSKADPDTRAAQMKALLGANRVVFSDAIRNSGINATALQSRVPGLTIKPDFSLQLKPAPARKASPLSSSGSTPVGIPDVTLRPPFDFESTETNNGGLAYTAAKAHADENDGTARMHITVIGVAGGAYGSAQVGDTIDVPAGVDRVEITTTARISYTGSAFSALFVSQSCTTVAIDLWTADLDSFIDGDVLQDCTVAPIGWYSEMSGDETRDYVYSANVTGSNQHFVVVGYAFADSLGSGVPGYAESEAKAEITKIRVHFIKN